MKKQMTVCFLTVIMSISGHIVMAHDLEVKNADGITIYYNIINNDTELEVSCKGDPHTYRTKGDYSGDVVIPEIVTNNEKTYNVTSIGYNAFLACENVSSITIPNSVTTIGDYAFAGCRGLTSIMIPNSVTSIGDNAFRGCYSLTSITIPNGIKCIEEYTFDGCSGLKTISIPQSVAIIESGAFYNCFGLTSISLPSNLTSIKSYTFAGCSSLSSVTVPNNVTIIGNHAFDGCNSLSSVTIPNNVTNIEDYAFQNCSSMTDIILPNRITTIGGYSFNGCSSITSINIPNNVTNIKSWAFANCTSLTTVTMPNSMSNIGKEAFRNCKSLTSVTISNSVAYIGDWAFVGCNNLMTVNSEIKEPFSCNNIFSDDTYRKGTLYVPVGTKEPYSHTDGWSKFLNIEELSVPENQKCAIPILSYSNKELKYDCATNGATIHETIKCSDAATTTFSGSHKLNAVYEISAYATADGYYPSETINAKLYWVEGSLESSNISSVRANTRGILIQSDGDFLRISGLNDNEQVTIYDMSGKLLGTSKSVGGTAIFGINKTDKYIVVKIGDDAIKVHI